MLNKRIASAMALILLLTLFAPLAPFAPGSASAAEAVVRQVSVEETAGKARTNTLVRIPLTLEDSEGLTDPAYLRVYLGAASLIFQATDVVRYPSGHVKGANVYVADSFAAKEAKQYHIAIADTPVINANAVTVTETAADLVVAGQDLSMTFAKPGSAFPGTIKAITTTAGTVTIGSPGTGANAYLGNRAAIKLERIISRDRNDEFESGTYSAAGTPDGWNKVPVAGTNTFEWSAVNYKHGSKSVKIANTGVNDSALWESDPLPAVQGSRYYLEGWIKGQSIVKPASGTNPGATVGFRFYDAGGTLLSEVFSTDSASASWTSVYTPVVNIPVGAATMTMFASLKGSGSAWFDLLTLAEGDVTSTHMANTPATQQNNSITYETGPLFAKVKISNQMVRSGAPVPAYTAVEYLIPAVNPYFQQTILASGDPANPDSGVEVSGLMLLQGRLFLGGNDTAASRNDQIVSYSSGTGGSSLASGDTKKALVDTAAGLAFLPVSSMNDGFTNMDYNGEELRVMGGGNLPVGLSRFYFHFYTRNRMSTSFVFSNGTGSDALNSKAIEYANPLVGIVDRTDASFDADILPLVKAFNDYAGNTALRPDAWTMNALANYVNYDLTGDPVYKTRADQIVNTNATAAMETVAYWENQIHTGAFNVWTLQGLYSIGMHYNGWDRLWKIADAVGQAHEAILGFTDSYGYFHLANSSADAAAYSANANMEFDAGLIYLWGHKQANNTAAYNKIMQMFSNPIHQNYVNAFETPYRSVSGSLYEDVLAGFQPHYTALTVSMFEEAERISERQLTLNAPNYRLMYNTVDIDTGSIGEDSTGWPQYDLMQHHFWRWGFVNFYAYAANLFYGNLGQPNPQVGVTTLQKVLQRYLDGLAQPVSDQTGVTAGTRQYPLIVQPDTQYPFNLYGYYGAREYDPTSLINLAAALNKMYLTMKKGLLENGGFERNPTAGGGWATQIWSGSPVFAWTADVKRSAGYSVSISGTGVNGGFNKSFTNAVKVTPGVSYTLSAWAKTDQVTGSASDGAWIWIEQMNVANQVIAGSRWDSAKINGTQDWTQLQHTFTAMPEAASIRLYIHLRGSGTVWYDDITLEAE